MFFKLGVSLICPLYVKKEVLNTPPILSIVMFFKLGVSLICPLYVKKEEWIGKNLYYRNINYVTSKIENFRVYLQ